MSFATIWRRCCLVSLALVVAASASAEPFEKALPSDVVLFVNIANVKAMKEKLGKTELGGLLADTGMQPYFGGIQSEIVALFDKAKALSGVDALELLAVPSGQVAVAVQLTNNDIKDPPTVYFMADVAGKEELIQAKLAQLGTAVESKGLTQRKVGDLTVYAKPNAKPGEELCYGLKGSILAIGNNSEKLTAAVAGLSQGVSSSLLTSPSFTAFRTKADGASDIELFLDPASLPSIIGQLGQRSSRQFRAVGEEIQPSAAGLERVVMGLGAKAGIQASGPKETLEKLGFGTIKAIGLTASFFKGDYETLQSLIVVTNGPSDLMNMVKFASGSLTPESWVPENISNYATATFDIDSFFATLSKVMEAERPGMMAMADRSLSQLPDPNNPLVSNIKNDIVDPINGRMTQLVEVAESQGKLTPRQLFVLKLDDAAKFKTLIDRAIEISGNGQGMIENKDVAGNTVYTWALGDLIQQMSPDPDAASGIGVLGFTVANGNLYFATHVELLDKVLAADGGVSVAENANYRRVAAKFPAQTAAIFYANNEANGRSFWEVLKRNDLAKSFRQGFSQANAPAGMLEILEPLLNSLDGSKLPDFDSVKKYYEAPVGGYMTQDETGILLNQFKLKK